MKYFHPGNEITTEVRWNFFFFVDTLFRCMCVCVYSSRSGDPWHVVTSDCFIAMFEQHCKFPAPSDVYFAIMENNIVRFPSLCKGS